LPRDFCSHGAARFFASSAFYHFIALKYRTIFTRFPFFVPPDCRCGTGDLLKRIKMRKNARISAVFLASRDKIYDNTKLEGAPSCRKIGWVSFVFRFLSTAFLAFAKGVFLLPYIS
jgi:hypothetical protein